MFFLGALVLLGSLGAFLTLGGLSVFGSARATTHQIIPGFLPDQPSPLERAATLLSVWGPVILITIFVLLLALRFVQMLFAG
jgi:hypothetical protein